MVPTLHFQFKHLVEVIDSDSSLLKAPQPALAHSSRTEAVNALSNHPPARHRNSSDLFTLNLYSIVLPSHTEGLSR